MTTDPEAPKRPYIGGGEGTVLKPRFQALYREVKSRKRAVALFDLFWPEDLEYPNTSTISSWCSEVEQQKAKVPKYITEWIRGQLEQERMQSLHESGIEAATTFTYYAKKMRTDGSVPPGGVVALKYLADAAGFQLGKHSEIEQQVHGKKPSFSLGNLNISVAPPKKQLPAGKVIDAEYRELDGSPA